MMWIINHKNQPESLTPIYHMAFISLHIKPTYRTETDFTKQCIKSYFGGLNTTYVNATIKSLLKLVRLIRAGVWVDQWKSIPVTGEQTNWRKLLCS